MKQLFLSMESGFYHLTSTSYFDYFLILLLFGLFFQLKDWKKYLSLFTAVAVGSLIGFLLAAFTVSNFSHSTIKLLLALSVLAVAAHNMISNSVSANAVRYNFFALIGLVLGTGISLYYERMYGNSIQFFKLVGYSLGTTIGYFVVSFAGILLSALIIALFKSDRRSFNLVASGMGIGIAIVLIYLRY